MVAPLPGALLLLWAVPRPAGGSLGTGAAAARDAAAAYEAKFRELAGRLAWDSPGQAISTLGSWIAFTRRWLAAARAAWPPQAPPVTFYNFADFEDLMLNNCDTRYTRYINHICSRFCIAGVLVICFSACLFQINVLPEKLSVL